MDLKIPKDITNVLNFSHGAFTQGHGEELKVVSPYTGQVIGKLNCSTTEDVDTAVKAAAQAQVSWGRTPIKERSRVMFNFRHILLREIKEISNTVSLESGKTLAEAEAGVMKGIEVLEYALSLQNTDAGGRMEVSRGVMCEFRREPLGVVAGITPFNFPAMVPMWMIPIALTLGNAFVWKPSEKTPLTSILIAKALDEAGIPKGIFTVVQGNRQTAEAILQNKTIRAVGFVGSTPVAESVYKLGTANNKRVLALGGAKNHIILMPDADPEMASKAIADSFTGCAGQRCMAASVLLAVGEASSLVEKIVSQARSLELGKTMGAIVTKESKEKLVSAIGRAEKSGVKVLLDGRTSKAPSGLEGGNWLSPTVLDNVTPGMEAAVDELFGPVLSIIHCKNLSEALAIENSSVFGNAASVFTSNGSVAERVASEAKSGMIGINVGVPVPREPFSFGGINESKFGQGDITGESSLDFWSNRKKVTTKWDAAKDANWMS